jgi:transposase
MQLEVKTVLNRIQHFPDFVFEDIQQRRRLRQWQIEIKIKAHASRNGRCSVCLKRAPGYDRLPERSWLFVPLWGLITRFFYAPRRVSCPEHGVVVEHLPWSEGKRPITRAMMGFLARWSRHLSWRQTARSFHTSWECVYRSVAWYVEWGLEHRKLVGVESLGVDDLYWGKRKDGNSFLTVIYQIDGHCRRLLWVGRKRTQATLRRGLAELGPKVVGKLRFVCSDMWRPYLNVIAAEVGHALNVLDRFHITTHLNQAVDKTRRSESARLRASSSAKATHLKKMRWNLLRRRSRVRGRARIKLNALIASKLDTARAWILKETFEHFWTYKSTTWAGGFLDHWTWLALRSRLEPMQKVAKMLRSHRELLLNWFRAKGELSSGAVEGMNNKIRVVTRRSYGFRTYRAMEIALYHNLGRLPEPDENTHRFC